MNPHWSSSTICRRLSQLAMFGYRRVYRISPLWCMVYICIQIYIYIYTYYIYTLYIYTPLYIYHDIYIPLFSHCFCIGNSHHSLVIQQFAMQNHLWKSVNRTMAISLDTLKKQRPNPMKIPWHPYFWRLNSYYLWI